MNNFQTLVFTITLFSLLIALTMTAFVLYNQKSSIPYPPVVDNCPDYWYSSYYNIDNSGNAIPDSSQCADTTYGCCPDKVTPKTDDTGTTCPVAQCYNVKKLGILETENPVCKSQMDFSANNTCDKQTWANGCKVTWDGITNMPNAC
jgi:hypothetical protein